MIAKITLTGNSSNSETKATQSKFIRANQDKNKRKASVYFHSAQVIGRKHTQTINNNIVNGKLLMYLTHLTHLKFILKG